MNIKIDIANMGYGYVVKRKKLGLVYSYDGQTAIKEENDLGTYLLKQDVINIKGNLIKKPEQSYKVYLRMYYEIRNGTASYPVQFANIDSYNANLKGNYLFTYNKEEDKYIIE